MSYYADTDFFLALIKPSDWLKTGAQEIYNKHKENIETSVVTIIELMLVGDREKIDQELIIQSVFKISKVEGISKEDALSVAHLIKHEKIHVFDAFHAVLTKERSIISSDSVYDLLKIFRIKLNK